MNAGVTVSFFASNSAQIGGLQLQNIAIHPSYTGDAKDFSQFDLATFSVAFVAEEQKNRFDSFVGRFGTLSDAAIVKNQVVQLAGFGCEQETSEGLCDKKPGAKEFRYMKLASAGIDEVHAHLNPLNNRYFQLASPNIILSESTGIIAGGDSGGPVFDASQRIIGINRATVYSPVGNYSQHAWIGYPEAWSFINRSRAAAPGTLYAAEASVTFDYQNGDRYIGVMKNGQKSGQGKMLYANGNVYQGNWSLDKREGKGMLSWSPDDLSMVSFDGDWKDGSINGQGTMVFKNGDRYTGPFKLRQMNGCGGFYTKANGTVETGTWIESSKNGTFIQTTKAGKIYKIE